VFPLLDGSTYAGQGRKNTGSFKLKDMFFNMDAMRRSGNAIESLFYTLAGSRAKFRDIFEGILILRKFTAG
jgi:hypothetical protein